METDKSSPQPGRLSVILNTKGGLHIRMHSVYVQVVGFTTEIHVDNGTGAMIMNSWGNETEICLWPVLHSPIGVGKLFIFQQNSLST